MVGVKQELKHDELALELLVEISRLSRMPTVIGDRYRTFCIEHNTMSGLQIDFCLVRDGSFFYLLTALGVLSQKYVCI